MLIKKKKKQIKKIILCDQKNKVEKNKVEKNNLWNRV